MYQLTSHGTTLFSAPTFKEVWAYTVETYGHLTLQEFSANGYLIERK